MDGHERSGDDLVQLVRSRRAELGLSTEEVAQAGRAYDPAFNVAWINRLENRKLTQAPRKARLRALARALRLSEGTVLRAAGAQYLDIPDTPYNPERTARGWVDGFRNLNPDEQAQVLRLLSDGASRRDGA